MRCCGREVPPARVDSAFEHDLTVDNNSGHRADATLQCFGATVGIRATPFDDFAAAGRDGLSHERQRVVAQRTTSGEHFDSSVGHDFRSLLLGRAAALLEHFPGMFAHELALFLLAAAFFRFFAC